MGWGSLVKRDTTREVRDEDIPRLPFLEKSGDLWKMYMDVERLTILSKIYDFPGFPQFSPKELLKGDSREDGVVLIIDGKESKQIPVSKEELETELKIVEDKIAKSTKPDERELLEKLKEDIDNKIKNGDSSIDVELLGYYCRNEKNRPEIHLMMETIDTDVQLMTITFVHELMHAFFDSYYKTERFNVNENLEEPLAEYGMLCFMEQFSRCDPKNKELLTKAKNAVKKKRYNLGVQHYGYGYFLFEDKLRFGTDWISLFNQCCYTGYLREANLTNYLESITPIRYPMDERECALKLHEALHPVRTK